MKTANVILLVVLAVVVVHSTAFAQGVVTFYTSQTA
jgi:hypothetical protein